MKYLKINHAAVWVSIIVAQLIRPLWYDYVFFGIRWMELNEFVEEDFTSFSLPVGLIVALASGIAGAYGLAWFYTKLNVTSAVEGMKYAFIIWLCFRFLEVTTQNYFSLRPFELTILDETAVLMQYQIFGTIIGGWRKYKSE